MNIDQALEGLKYLIDTAESSYSEAYYLGEDVWDALDSLNYVYEFAKTMKAVHTTHDSKAESDEWDRFFEDIQKVTNGSD